MASATGFAAHGLGMSRGTAAIGGVARAQHDEDGKRRRPAFLVEPDFESVFGSDELTAPPVIGLN
jgi:hypothetical protein